MKSSVVQNFACPVDALYCPFGQDEITIGIDDPKKVYTREHKWEFPVPKKEAVDWNCKYIVKATDDFLKNTEPGSYVMLWVEVKGFHE